MSGKDILFAVCMLAAAALVAALLRRQRALQARLGVLGGAEDKLEQTRKMETRLRAMVEKAAEMVTLRDAQGELIYASPAMQQTMGYSPEEMKAMRFAEVIHPDDRPAALGAFSKLAPGQTLQGLRMRVRSKDGRWHWLEGNLSNFLEDPAVGAVVANFRDVTERLQMEEQLARASKMESIGHLAAGIAHDFNNLVTVISGYSEAALQGLQEDDPNRELFSPILRASQRAATLTRQLLAFSRKQVMQPKVVDLNQGVEGMGAMLKRVLGEQVEMRVLPAEGLGRVLIDPGQLEQIIMNLALNAKDAMPQGGKLTLETANVDLDDDYVRQHGEGQPGPHVMIALTDSGGGMDAEVRARIFEPFFTTKEVGKGTGLGLSTVYGIVKQSGGNIWVYSEPGRGSTFKIYLPRAEFEDAPQAPPPPASVDRGHETILLVEDEEAVRLLFRKLLAMNGYQVLDTGDTDEALRLCRQHPGQIHLLLTDMVMPKMGGRKLAEEVTVLRPGIKVAYMSGYATDAIVHQGVLEPGTAFIEKPVGRDELLKKVREFLG